MQLIPTLVAALPLAQAVNIVLSNDDGWAEINIRQFYEVLTNTNRDSVVISAPAENKSGSGKCRATTFLSWISLILPTGSLTATPTTLTEECEFNSCPSGSPAYGSNSSEPRFNYVNSCVLKRTHYLDSLLTLIIQLSSNCNALWPSKSLRDLF